jgi:hypothetical protein
MTRGRAIWPYRVTFRPYMDPSRNARRFSCWHSLVAPIYTTSRGGYKDLRALLDIRALPLLLNSTALQARGRWCRCCNVAGCSAPPTRAPPCGGIWGWIGRSNKTRVGFQVGNVRVVCRFVHVVSFAREAPPWRRVGHQIVPCHNYRPSSPSCLANRPVESWRISLWDSPS